MTLPTGNDNESMAGIAAPAAEGEAPAFTPRPAQARILAYRGGYMGISAVPGSGKTFTLSLLAAQLVEQLAGVEREAAATDAASATPLRRLDEREVLVVTFTNSAVANFRARIGSFLRTEKGLLPNVGYRVRTLHGLAHDIVRERPGLVGLSEDFDIVDDRTANEIKRDAVSPISSASRWPLRPSGSPSSCRTRAASNGRLPTTPSTSPTR